MRTQDKEKIEIFEVQLDLTDLNADVHSENVRIRISRIQLRNEQRRQKATAYFFAGTVVSKRLVIAQTLKTFKN